MDTLDEAIARIDSKLPPSAVGQSRRAVAIAIMAGQALAAAFEAAVSDLMAPCSGAKRRLQAAKRVLEPDMRPMLAAADEAFALAVVQRRRPGGAEPVAAITSAPLRPLRKSAPIR